MLPSVDRIRAPTDARAWRGARTFADLCALGARFATGEIQAFPGWGSSGLDEESMPLVPVLELCNRAGFLTVASQPGRAPRSDASGRVRAQRAFVAGFADEAAQIALSTLACADWTVLVHAPRTRGGPAIEVGRSGEESCLWAGHAAGQEELRLFRPSVSRAALLALEARAFVWVIDLAWEDREDFWRALRGALADIPAIQNPDPNPHTSHELP